jgi:ABC-type nitrate/sulfonate/bicarbonate transport system substrate-binding protein
VRFARLSKSPIQSLSFPQVLSGNPGYSVSGLPIKPFGSDGREKIVRPVKGSLALIACSTAVATVFLFVFLGDSFSAWAQTPQKLLVGYSSLSATQAVVWLAKEAGSFQRRGLDVELIYIGTGAKMTQAIVAGDIKIGQVGGAAPIAARLRGAEVKIVAVPYNTLALSLMAQTDIRSIADLKGKRIGISRFGSNTDFGIRYLLKKYGIAERDVVLLQFGDAQSIFGALQTGAIQAGPLSYPTTAAAIKNGFRELVDLSEIGLEFPNSNIAITDRYLQSQRDIVRRFLMAFVEGIHRYKTDETFSKRVMEKYLRVQDQTVLDETYKLFAPKISKIPYPTPTGFRLALESLSDEPRARTARPEDFYDDSILRALEKEGFIQQLYR